MSTAQELQEQGVKLFRQRDYEAAGRVFQQALDAYEADKQADMAAEMRTNIGLVHRSLGENQQAARGVPPARNRPGGSKRGLTTRPGRRRGKWRRSARGRGGIWAGAG